MRTGAELQRDLRMYLSRGLNRSLAPPDRVSVNLTLRCNLSCTMCTTCYDSPELSTDEVKGIIDQTSVWGVPVFNPLGGEPFMRSDIEELLAYAVRRGFYVSVTTNGTLITLRRARALAAVPTDRLHFNISLDGDASANDAIRGPGMWARAIEGYRRLREADAEAGNSRRKILANTILHANNLDRFEAILDEQAALGFDGVQVLNLFRAGPEASADSRALQFSPAQQPALLALCERLAQRAEAQPEAGYQIQNTPDELRMIPRYHTEALGPLEAPCWAGWKELYINADGAAIMCDGQLDFLNGTFGNVREQTLRQLWASPALRARRAVVKTCQTPCVQTCYLRGRSDSGAALLQDGAQLAISTLRSRLAGRLRGAVEHLPDATLTLELSDVCPCDDPACTTPPRRWSALTAGLPRRPSAETWGPLRDHGQLDFGRGFMGFDVVRAILDDLSAQGLRFGALSLRWRGEPLLHPEIEPILAFLLDCARQGRFDRLRLHTDGRFLTPALLGLLSQPAPLDLHLDLDRGDGEHATELLATLPADTQLLLLMTAHPHLSLDDLRRRAHGLPLLVGPRPSARRGAHLRAARSADPAEDDALRAHYLELAARLGQPVPQPDPRRCHAPARSPVVSWDGKLTLCDQDLPLELAYGSVTPGSLAALWRGRPHALAVEQSARGGTPERARCRSCRAPGCPSGA